MIQCLIVNTLILYLLQAKYIIRAVIAQMQGSEGYEVNLTSISLTPGLDY